MMGPVDIAKANESLMKESSWKSHSLPEFPSSPNRATTSIFASSNTSLSDRAQKTNFLACAFLKIHIFRSWQSHKFGKYTWGALTTSPRACQHYCETATTTACVARTTYDVYRRYKLYRRLPVRSQRWNWERRWLRLLGILSLGTLHVCCLRLWPSLYHKSQHTLDQMKVVKINRVIIIIRAY